MSRNREALSRNHARERRLWSNPEDAPLALGCSSCRFRAVCGGLNIEHKVFDCLSFCCGNLAACDQVCPVRTHAFTSFIHEVGGFDLANVPRTRPLPYAPLPAVVPLIGHGSSRLERLAVPAVAVSLYELFHQRTGEARFSSREELEDHFRIERGCRIVVSGVAKDQSIENFWGLGQRRRERLIERLAVLRLDLVTTPNFSLFTDVPRHDAMFAMKRIGLTFAELGLAGIGAALHPNASTVHDYDRWTEFVNQRPEVTHLAMEFKTGSGWAQRRDWHTLQLARLAMGAGRALHLVTRNRIEVLPRLVKIFHAVTVIDTTSFVATMKRRRAVRSADGRLQFIKDDLRRGEPLDERLAHNVAVYGHWLEERMCRT